MISPKLCTLLLLAMLFASTACAYMPYDPVAELRRDGIEVNSGSETIAERQTEE